MTEVINFRSFVSGEYKKQELTTKEIQTYEAAKNMIYILLIAVALKFMWPVAPALLALILKG